MWPPPGDGRPTGSTWTRATTPTRPPPITGWPCARAQPKSLSGVLAREGADLSAHEVRERASRQAASWAVLAQEYTTIAQEAQRQRWDEMLGGCGLDEQALQAVRGSPAFGPLLASMREAEARGLKVGAVLPRLVHARKFDDATDPAAVLHGRVQRWAAAAASKRRGRPTWWPASSPEPRALLTPTWGVLSRNVTGPCASERERSPRKPSGATSLGLFSSGRRPPSRWPEHIGPRR